MIISNLKVTKYLKVDIAVFAWQFSGFQVFIFDSRSFSDVLSFSSLGILVHILEPTKAAGSVPYLTVRIFRDLNLNSFLSGYRHSIKSKTSFMISGASFILTLNISMSNFCKLQLWISKEPSFAKSSLNVELWSWYTILTALSWKRFIWLFNLRLWNIQTTGA